MNDEANFSELLQERLRSKGMDLKKLSDASGVSLSHLERLVQGDFSALPAAPYFRGILMKLGKILEFEWEPWWDWFKKERIVKGSGSLDRLPINRFAKKSPGRVLGLAALAIILIAFIGVRFYKIIGKPQVAVSAPAGSYTSVAVGEAILSGTVSNADTVAINDEAVPLDASGSFEKHVTLQPGLNTFVIKAKKFLGIETDVVRQIFYEAQATLQPLPVPGSTRVPSTTVPAAPSPSGTPSDQLPL